MGKNVTLKHYEIYCLLQFRTVSAEELLFCATRSFFYITKKTIVQVSSLKFQRQQQLEASTPIAEQFK